MNPITLEKEGVDVKSWKSTLIWMVKSHDDISRSSIGLFFIAVLANNFFHFLAHLSVLL